MASKKRGCLINFEGIDRSGKSTQTELLVRTLNAMNKKSVLIRFPARDTPTGKVIDAYLKNCNDLDDQKIHKLFSDNRWEFADSIRMYLEKGIHVILDRYAFSGVAFSASKGLDIEECKDSDRGLPAPDIVLFLDLPLKIVLTRGDFGQERYEKEDFQRNVLKMYQKLRDSTWINVNANQSILEVEKVILDFVLEKIKEPRDQIKPLWKTDSRHKVDEPLENHINLE